MLSNVWSKPVDLSNAISKLFHPNGLHLVVAYFLQWAIPGVMGVFVWVIPGSIVTADQGPTWLVGSILIRPVQQIAIKEQGVARF